MSKEIKNKEFFLNKPMNISMIKLKKMEDKFIKEAKVFQSKFEDYETLLNLDFSEKYKKIMLVNLIFVSVTFLVVLFVWLSFPFDNTTNLLNLIQKRGWTVENIIWSVSFILLSFPVTCLILLLASHFYKVDNPYYLEMKKLNMENHSKSVYQYFKINKEDRNKPIEGLKDLDEDLVRALIAYYKNRKIFSKTIS